MTDAPPMLALEGVSQRFVKRLDIAARIANLLGAGLKDEVVHAVDHVDLAVRQGEVVGLVGESGCGKSTLGRIAAGILPPTEGRRLWRGKPVSEMPAAEARAVELSVQMIFQDPFASLNPRLRVVDIVGEAPVVHGMVKGSERDAYVGDAIRTSSPAASGRAWASPARSRSSRSSWCATRRWPRSTCRSRPRC
jgi:peptide/nickel transport system ATP-binding protein